MDRLKALTASTRTFFKEVAAELRKVTWPTWRNTLLRTGIVLGMVVVVAGYLYILDWPLSYGVEKFLGR